MKNLLLLKIAAILALIGLVYVVGSGSLGSITNTRQTGQQERENSQVVEILAKNGYFPRNIVVEPGRLIDLKVKTKNTFDCSADFRIKKLGIATVLQPNNEEIFQLPILRPGEEIDGSCGMGMYGFVIKARG